MLDQMASVFFEEANELLDNLEDYLLTLESEPENQEVISAVFRAMHTIKGSSGMFGFDAIQSFTHEMESAFDFVRSGIVPVQKELITITLEARDHIRDMLGKEITPQMQETSAKIIGELHAYTGRYKSGEKTESDSGAAAAPADTAAAAPSGDASGQTWHISFKPSPNVLQNGTRPELLVKELCELGQAEVTAHTDGLPALINMNPENCYVSWDITLHTDKTENDIQDVFIFLDADSVVTVTKDGGSEAAADAAEAAKPEPEVPADKAQAAAATPSAGAVPAAPAASPAAPAAAPAGGGQSVIQQTIKVNSEKLDQLIDLVGEMVTFNARLAQTAQEMQVQQVTALSELSERLVFALRDTAMDMRMLPIGTIFSRFRRLVHDLSNQLGKNMELVTEGAETELDKTVIEKLNDPLIHLIRNSADHGIETPDIRRESGKPEQGIITLSAKHAGAFVLITISDDGAGLDKEGIRNKAVERGLIQASDVLSDQDLYELIFRPGFSTNKTVTSLSGRGVGMDVVRRDIGSLGGTVSVETVPGKGSSFILKIPLTLAIIDGMLVQIGKQQFVIPLTNIDECVELNGETDVDSLCSHITTRGTYLPCINMHRYFELEEPAPENSQVVIVNDNDSKIGIIVDYVVGNHQTVIKPIGELYKYIAGISGSTILGDGSIALILDILKLSQIVRKVDQDKQ